MGTAVDELVALLDLEQLELDLFRGITPVTDSERVFGGQVLAQALMAAGRTVKADGSVEVERPVHSMHAYFLRLGDPKIPIVFEVDRIRDGRSFTTRRVVAVQHGKAIFNMAASFQVEESGPDHSDPMPDVKLPGAGARMQWRPPPVEPIDQPRGPHVIEALDLRPVGGVLGTPGMWDDKPRDPDQDVWVRINGRLPDDRLLHACMIAYLSDLTLLGTATLPHGAPFSGGGFMMASLDHVMWFHRPCRADEWLLYRMHSPSASAARGFSRGEMYPEGGALAVSLAQEGLFRPLR